MIGLAAMASTATLAEAAQAPPQAASSGEAQGSGAPVRAILEPPYPDANDPSALGRWFGQTTHLPAKSVLAITDNAIFAAFPQHDTGPFWTVDVRLESLTPQSTVKLGGRSIRLRLNVRCDNNTVRLIFLDVFPGADLTGAPLHRAPPNSWAVPKPNSYVFDAVRLVCDKTFQGPLAGIGGTVAQASPEPAPKSPPQAAPPQAAPRPETAAERPPALRGRQTITGSYAVQIGAYSTAGASQGAWIALHAAKPGVTNGLLNDTKPIQVGGRTLYRAIVQGFPSSAAAATFCEALRTSGRPCLLLGAVKP